jgi:hypothetical protein
VIVMFAGEFESGDGQRIIAALEETGAAALGLNSVGGLVSEAQMVGYYLRSHNLDTIAGEVCASACTFALAGGVDRLAIDERASVCISPMRPVAAAWRMVSVWSATTSATSRAWGSMRRWWPWRRPCPARASAGSIPSGRWN